MPRQFRLTGRSKLLKAAILKTGGDAALARRLGISRQAIGQWNEIPPVWVRRIKQVVGNQNVAVPQ